MADRNIVKSVLIKTIMQLSGNIQNRAAFEIKSLFSLVTQLKTFLLQSTVVKQFTPEIK